MTNSNIKVIISWILLSTAFFVLSNSLETQEHLDVINQHPGCQGRKCQIVEVKFLKRQKRSAEVFDLNIGIELNGKMEVFHLKASNGILVTPKTPVYYVSSDRNGRNNVEKKDNIFTEALLAMHFIDEEKKAVVALAMDPITKETTIKTAFIGTENLVVDRTTANNKDYYIARTVPNSNVDILGVGLNLRYVARSSSEIPETIYPEVLVCVDYQYYNLLKDNLMMYILQFWNAVDLYYHQLRNPRYKLSIAGVVVAKDENVFPFGSPSYWGTNNLIPYNSSLDHMPEWLRSAREIIPFNSYDTYIYMTPYRDGLVTEGVAIGMAPMSSACYGSNFGKPLGGTVYDRYNLEGILTAVHELGHVFGANHDKEWPCSSHSIMWPSEAPEHELWSQCSIESFRSNLRNEDFSCMYNEPVQIENPSTLDIQIPISPKYNQNQPSTLYHKEITDDRYQVSVGSSQFARNREVKIYYRHNTLVITQLHNKVTATFASASNEDLQTRFPDDKTIKFDPSIIKSSKLVNIYHENGYIYIYQGKKPTGDTDESQQSDNNNQESDLYSTDDQHSLCFERSDLKLHKVVEIYYRNNLLYVSQNNVPDNFFYRASYRFTSIQKVRPDTEKYTMYPTQISPGIKVCVQHINNQIVIFSRNSQPAS